MDRLYKSKVEGDEEGEAGFSELTGISSSSPLQREK